MTLYLAHNCDKLSCPFLLLIQILVTAGTVQSVLRSGDLRVKYPSGQTWTLNPDTVVKVME